MNTTRPALSLGIFAVGACPDSNSSGNCGRIRSSNSSNKSKSRSKLQSPSVEARRGPSDPFTRTISQCLYPLNTKNLHSFLSLFFFFFSTPHNPNFRKSHPSSNQFAFTLLLLSSFPFPFSPLTLSAVFTEYVPYSRYRTTSFSTTYTPICLFFFSRLTSVTNRTRDKAGQSKTEQDRTRIPSVYYRG